MSIPFATTSWSGLTTEQKEEFYAWLNKRKTTEDFEGGVDGKVHVVTDRCDSCSANRWAGEFGDEARREALAASDQGRLAEWERELMEPLPDGDAQITAPAEEETTEQLLDRLESAGDAERQQAEEKQKEMDRILAAKATVAGHYSEDAAWLDDDRLRQIAGTLDYFASAASVLAARQGFCSEFDRIAQLVGIQSTKDRRELAAGLPLFFDSMLVPDVLLHGIATAVHDSGYEEQYRTLTEEFDILLNWPEAQEKETHYDVSYTVTGHSYTRELEPEELIELIRNGDYSRENWEEADCDCESDFSFDYDTSDARAFMSALAVLGVTV